MFTYALESEKKKWLNTFHGKLERKKLCAWKSKLSTKVLCIIIIIIIIRYVQLAMWFLHANIISLKTMIIWTSLQKFYVIRHSLLFGVKRQNEGLQVRDLVYETWVSAIIYEMKNHSVVCIGTSRIQRCFIPLTPCGGWWWLSIKHWWLKTVNININSAVNLYNRHDYREKKELFIFLRPVNHDCYIRLMKIQNEK